MRKPHIYDRAFPVSFKNDDGGVTTTLGLTKREYYAGLAMQGLICKLGESVMVQSKSDLAWQAIEAADALIAELARTETTEEGDE